MRWTQSSLEERKAWGAEMALARKNKGIKFSEEHKKKLSESNKIAYQKKKESGWKHHNSYSRRDPKELASIHINRQYRSMSKLRGFGDSGLSKDQINKLISGNCVYCGDGPRERIVKFGHYPITIIANGIDRVDNKKPYVIENCVSCCKTCNLMKHKMSVEDFKNHIRKVYTHAVNVNIANSIHSLYKNNKI